jgi:hypothetical protein
MPQGYRTASVQFLKGLDLFKNTTFGLPQTDGTVPLITWVTQERSLWVMDFFVTH